MSRGEHAITWILKFCLQPAGPHEGRRARLTPLQRETLRRLYSDPSRPQDGVVGELAAYVALLCLCGPASLRRDPPVLDSWSIWRAAGPELREVLEREGETIRC